DMVRQHASYGLVESAGDRLVGHFKVRPCFVAAGAYFIQRLLAEIQRCGSSISLEVGTGAVALDGVAPLRNAPLEFRLRKKRSLGQIDFDAVTGRLDVADIDHVVQSGGPEPRDGASTGVEREILAGVLVMPARRHNPGVLIGEVSFLRPGK